MDQAAALLALQEADLELLRLRAKLDGLPEKRAILDARAKKREIEALRAKVDVLRSKLEAELRKRTDEVATLTEKIDVEQAKLIASSDHRQVQSLSREMDGLKRRRDKVEMESLEFEERIEKAVDQAAKVDVAITQIDAQEASLVATFQEVGGELQQRIRAVEADRATLAGGLDADLLARYEENRTTKSGIGVGRLENGTCTACRMALPATQVALLNAGDEVGVCPACRRLLVVRTECAES